MATCSVNQPEWCGALPLLVSPETSTFSSLSFVSLGPNCPYELPPFPISSCTSMAKEMDLSPGMGFQGWRGSVAEGPGPEKTLSAMAHQCQLCM